METLENRQVLSNFLVSTTADTGPGSLRQAILDANASPGTDAIAFQIGAGGPQTILPNSALPVVTDPAVIDGTTQPGYDGTPIIELSGAQAGAGVNGLTISAGASTVRGLVISGFGESGLWLHTNGGNVVAGNFVGTDLSGQSARPNLSVGLRVTSGSNLIGGTTPESRNVVSGNRLSGIYIESGSGNLIQGNYAGTDKTGANRLENGGAGIRVGGSDNTVGGLVPAARNLVVGGVTLVGRAQVAQGNYVGTDVTGTRALGSGSIFTNGSDHVIGGTAPGAGNVLRGLQLGTANASGIVVQGNHIGVDVTGTAPLVGVGASVGISVNGFNHLIGGTTPAARNIISGNNLSGVRLEPSARNNRVQGNYIGTDITGTYAIPNDGNGVDVGDVRGGGNDNLIGGPEPGAGNLISGNRRAGVGVYGSANRVQGNTIGTDVTGTYALPNREEGVRLGNLQTVGSRRNLIGGPQEGAGNLISGNGRAGVAVDSSGDSAAHIIQGNFIGTDASGTRAIPNTTEDTLSCAVATGTDNLVGGTEPGAGNLISGNQWYGLCLGSSGNVAQGNRIGTDVTGTRPLGNGRYGVWFGPTSAANILGGTAPGAGNLIAFNGTGGIEVDRGVRNALRGNAIWGHTSGLGIRLLNGGNSNQAAPQLTAAGSFRGRVSVVGSLRSAPSTTFGLEFFASPSCHPSGFGEGQQLVGTLDVTTNAAGNAAFVTGFDSVVPRGWVLTATATDPAGNTSAFSACVPLRGRAFVPEPVLESALLPLLGRAIAPRPALSAPMDAVLASTPPALASDLLWSVASNEPDTGANQPARNMAFVGRGDPAEFGNQLTAFRRIGCVRCNETAFWTQQPDSV